MQPPAARLPWASWRLAAVAVVCVAAALLVSASGAGTSAPGGPAPRALGGRLVVRDTSDAAASLEAYGRDDSAALVEAFLQRGGRVTAFIFFGRRRYTAVQWPYLLAARRSDGAGLLSQVVYVANTHDKEDLEWLDKLQAAHADYVLVQQPERVVRQNQNNADYCALYREVGGGDAGDALVIKVDDDIVYVAPDALRNLVAAKLRNQHLLFVSANVVNHPLLAHVHQCVPCASLLLVCFRRSDCFLANVGASACSMPLTWRAWWRRRRSTRLRTWRCSRTAGALRTAPFQATAGAHRRADA